MIRAVFITACTVMGFGCVEFDVPGLPRDAGVSARDDAGATGERDGADEGDGSFTPPGDGDGEPVRDGADDFDAGSTGDGTPGGDGSDAGDGASEPANPEDVIFAEDFEGAAEDSVPSDWHSFVSYQVDPQSNTKASNAFALVDSTRAHGGTKSLHVKGGGSPAMLTRALPEGTNAIHVRVYAYLAGSLGQAPSRNHETLLGIRRSVGGANDEVRFGEIKGVIGVNEVPSDNISPRMDQWGSGPLITAGAWHCIEVAFRGDLPAHEVRAWNDGEEVFVVNDASQWQNGPLSKGFLDGKFVEFILGWHSFSNYENELFLDDLVVSRAPPGC